MLVLPGICQAKLFRRCLRIAELFEVVRRDGFTLRLTTSDMPIDRFGKRFFPAQFGSSGDERRTAGFRESRQLVNGFSGTDAASITIPDLLVGRYKGARVTYWIVDLDEPWTYIDKDVKWVREIQHDGSEYIADLQGIGMWMQRQGGGPNGGIFSPTCRASLGDGRCKKDISSFVASAGVTSVQDDYTDFEVNTWGGSFAEDFYAEGEVEWAHLKSPVTASRTTTALCGIDSIPVSTTPPFAKNEYKGKVATIGNLALRIIENDLTTLFVVPDDRLLTKAVGSAVVIGDACKNGGMISPVGAFQNSPRRFQLYIPTPEPIEVGDQVIVRPGCDGLLTTCVGKWSNANNFRGSPLDPGAEKIHEPGQDQ